ncbi:hypothetical protein BH11PSE2_BH11PSE2_15710 [soil metagenome]
MTRTRQVLCLFYAAISVIALLATWSQNLAYFGGGAAGAGQQFVLDAMINPASRSITIDIGLFLLAATGFMVTEARRLGLRLVWVYVIAGFLIAISFTFPLFMIAREMRLAKSDRIDGAARLTASDIIGLAVTTLVILGLTGFILH